MGNPASTLYVRIALIGFSDGLASKVERETPAPRTMLSDAAFQPADRYTASIGSARESFHG